MGFSIIRVNIEPDYGVYMAGQVVTGTVVATVASETKCRAVKVSCKGKAKVHWREKEGDDYKNFDASEEYFKLSINVWSDPSEKIQGGNYSWPFQFTIPVGCPSSFEGSKGWVRYKITAKADIPFGFDDKASAYFSVTDPDDLNFNEAAKRPLVVQKADTSCCCCCMKGPVQLNFNCPRSGAVIGENFKIRGEVSNEGSKEVEDTEIILTQKVKYHARGRSKTSTEQIGKIKKGSIPPGESFYYEDVPLKIESVVPNLKKCHIIDVTYTIYFSANFGVCAAVDETLPFIIGTVPFMVEGATSIIPSQPMMLPGPQPYTSPAPPPYSTMDPAQGGAPPPPPPGVVPVESSDAGFVKTLNEDGTPSAPPAGFAPVGMPEGQPGYPGMPMTDPNMPMPAPGMPVPAPGMPMPSPGMHMPAPGIPMPPGTYPVAPGALPPPNPYPTKGPPMPEVCYLCRKDRTRLDSKAPPPKYLSYDSVIE